MASMRSTEGLLGASPKAHARIAGAVGLLVLASGSVSGVVASRLIARGDIATTLSNIAASEEVFRIGITGGLVMMIAWLVYATLLFQLFAQVNKVAALLMLALVMASVPIYMLNQGTQFAALLLAPGKQLPQAELFLQLHRFGNLVAALFFGLWLLPLGWLVFRSGFLPRFLGIFVMVGSAGYLVLFVQGFHFPSRTSGLWGNPLLVVTHVAELSLLLWLLVRGVNLQRWEAGGGLVAREPARAAPR